MLFCSTTAEVEFAATAPKQLAVPHEEVALPEQFTISRLTSARELSLFASFAVRDQMEQAYVLSSQSRLIALGAYDDHGRPVGFLLAISDGKKSTDILSVFVQREYRRRGIAKNLLQQAELAARELKTLAVCVALAARSESSPIRGLLAACDWNSPPKRMRLIETQFSVNLNLSKASWQSKRIQHPALKLSPWEDVSTSELLELTKLSSQEETWFPRGLSPIVGTDELYGPLSLGLRFNGKLIGWIITQRSPQKQATVNSLFARPIPECPMAGLALLQTLTRRLLELSQSGEIKGIRFLSEQGNKLFDFLLRWGGEKLPMQVTELEIFQKWFCQETEAQNPSNN